MDDPFTYLEDFQSAATSDFYTSWNSAADTYFQNTAKQYFTEAISRTFTVETRGLPKKGGKYWFFIERKKIGRGQNS